MIHLDIQYSLEYEKERINYTLNKADWFIEKGYSKSIKLPASKKLDELDVSTSKDYLFGLLEDEYVSTDYEMMKNNLSEQWSSFVVTLEKYFEETSLKQEDTYVLQLTKYGVGGSYNLPNTVILNFQNRTESALFRTVVHEIIHLSIQKYIEQYNADHWIKERIVDLTLERIAPELNTMQNLPIDTKSVDLAFEKNYPNMEEVIKNA
ncbi:MAG: hypothetical protein KBD24_03005 [Candidatus Pacebacteria bacterium]|nr:hypothetical protein [Candidatus Paceibacterota bacterium]